MSDKDIIEAQNQKIEKLESIFNSILNEPLRIGTVKSGPVTIHEKDLYKVDLSGQELVVSASEIGLMGEIKDLEKGSYVTILAGSIIGILPKELQEVKETTVSLTSWDEIGGLKSQIENIKDIIELPLANASVAKDFGVQPSKGMLLYGPPGCGKTLIAKAIASSILKTSKVDPRAFIYVKGAELLSMYVGQTEQQIGKMFKSTREYMKETGKQAIIFIDEAEAILPNRGSRRSSDVDATIVPTFLSEMDGFDDLNPFVLLSTNLPENIDSAILREGRIDTKIPVLRPVQSDAEEIFKIHFKGVKCCDNVDMLCKSSAEKLFNSSLKDRASGSMIKVIVNQAARNAMKRKIQTPKTKSFGIVEDDIIESLKVINHANTV